MSTDERILQERYFPMPNRIYSLGLCAEEIANVESLQPDGIYMRYIATRPGAEKHGEHGLFGSSFRVDLDTALYGQEEERRSSAAEDLEYLWDIGYT